MAAGSAEERLLNLIIALMHARVRMTKDEIRARVAGYEREDSSWDEETAKRRKATFERMFERDKDALRKLGIPVVTVRSQAHGDDIGYRIDPSQAALPPLDFTPAESAVVALAADYWRGAALGADASQAWVKASSQIAHGQVDELPFATTSSRLSDAAAALVEAIQLRQEVAFDYASASSGDARRRVQPWKILLSRGADYLVGLDLDRVAPRTFRLSRVASDVRVTGEPGAYEVPGTLPSGLTHSSDVAGEALIAVRPETAHALRAAGTDAGTDGDWDLVRVPYAHRDDLRDQVLALGGAARVIEPEGLKDEVLGFARAAVEVCRGS
ncbi:helix-turn-helix transcriptional regulator [Demequina globuliformis]|uniref:helix-turn-helix transcriptional regulator n=1 Tax=Demequina globuliformis TaxID=676202 RepID=UPI000786072B|nr:WYL domain-containing protein [Demequina globuliformis]